MRADNPLTRHALRKQMYELDRDIASACLDNLNDMLAVDVK